MSCGLARPRESGISSDLNGDGIADDGCGDRAMREVVQSGWRRWIGVPDTSWLMTGYAHGMGIDLHYTIPPGTRRAVLTFVDDRGVRWTRRSLEPVAGVHQTRWVPRDHDHRLQGTGRGLLQLTVDARHYSLPIAWHW